METSGTAARRRASFESFRGDRPKKPERVSIDGSFKAGRDGDKPGIIFKANPTMGEFYVEEASLDNAEDATEILSTSYAFGKNPELDELVPRKLAKLLCSGDCVVTRNFSLLEPECSSASTMHPVSVYSSKSSRNLAKW